MCWLMYWLMWRVFFSWNRRKRQKFGNHCAKSLSIALPLACYQVQILTNKSFNSIASDLETTAAITTRRFMKLLLSPSPSYFSVNRNRCFRISFGINFSSWYKFPQLLSYILLHRALQSKRVCSRCLTTHKQTRACSCCNVSEHMFHPFNVHNWQSPAASWLRRFY